MISKSFIALFTMGTMFAAEPEAHTWKSPNGTEILYRLASPEMLVKGKTYPLILFLHGAGERGTDNTAQLVNGVNPILEGAAKLDQPVFLIAPQCPPESWWAQPNKEITGLADVGGENKLLTALLDLIDETAKTKPIDRRRIYLTGLSMGGFGTWDLLGRAPEVFAAAMPICAGGDPGLVEKYKHVPIHIFHGAADNVVPPAGSKMMFEALKKAGSNAKLTLYPGVGHDSWTPTYANPEVIAWLFSQRKPD